MKIETRKKGVAESISITIGERWLVKDTLGRVVEIWESLSIGTNFKRQSGLEGRYVYFAVTTGLTHG